MLVIQISIFMSKVNKVNQKREFEIGDKVVYSESGKKALGINRPDIIKHFESVVYGIVMSSFIETTRVRWINNKGIVVFPNWKASSINLELYNG